MQLQGLPAGNRTASSGLPDQCSTAELQKPLPTTWARVQYIYISEIVMPVKYKAGFPLGRLFSREATFSFVGIAFADVISDADKGKSRFARKKSPSGKRA